MSKVHSHKRAVRGHWLWKYLKAKPVPVNGTARVRRGGGFSQAWGANGVAGGGWKQGDLPSLSIYHRGKLP